MIAHPCGKEILMDFDEILYRIVAVCACTIMIIATLCAVGGIIVLLRLAL